MQTGVSLEIEGLVRGGEIEGLLHLWNRLPCQEGLVNDTLALQEENVTWHDVIIFGTTYKQDNTIGLARIYLVEVGLTYISTRCHQVRGHHWTS